MNEERIGFGGGCHWCTEAVFNHVPGVTDVRQGFISSAAPDDSWSEGVVLRFDPDRISLDHLVTIHLKTHSSGADHSMREKYRSAVYTTATAQHAAIQTLLAEAATLRTVITRALPLMAFRPSEARFRHYYAKNRGKPFCETYIEPKLDTVRELTTDYPIPDAGH